MTANSNPARGRLTTTEVNAFSPDPRLKSNQATAENAPIPLIYGRVPVPGLISGGTDLDDETVERYVRVIWGYGPIHAVETIYLNGAALDSSIQVRTYLGTPFQPIDSWLDAAIPGYDEDLRITRPDGVYGIAYSVFRIPAGVVSGLRFDAIIQGRQIYDPREILNVDPYYHDVGYDVRFEGVNGTTPTSGLDFSSSDHATTWNSNAEIQADHADFDGTDDYVSIPGVTATEFGAGPFTWETKVTPTNISAGTRYIITKGNSIRLFQSGAALKISLSSAGSSFDIVDTGGAGASAFAAGVETNICLEWTGREYYIYVDGWAQWRVASTDAVFASSGSAVLLGNIGAGGTGFVGKMRATRLTKGYNRYGSPHYGPHTSNQPYVDSLYTAPGLSYSDISALVFNDLATSTLYGLGVETVTGLSDSLLWNLEQAGGEDRARVALVIAGTKPTESQLDYLAGHCECFWYPDGDGVTLTPDRKVEQSSPSGWEMGENGEFIDNAAEWTLGTGWTHNGTPNQLSKTAGTASDARQNIGKPFETGVVYVATFSVAAVTAGNVRLLLDAVEIIANRSSAGTYGAAFVATSPTHAAEIIVEADSAFVGQLDKVTIRRKYWADNAIIMGSLEVAGLSDRDTPTRVNVQWTEEVVNSPKWRERTYSVEMPGVSEGDIALIETTLRMPGIYREQEAANKALTKLFRMQNRARVTWRSTDLGVALRKGTIVRVPDSEYGKTLAAVVESVNQIEPGRYQVTGTRYDVSHYPDAFEVPPGLGEVHPGMIVALQGSNVPSGWAQYTTADGDYIKISDGVEDAGDIGGTATAAGFFGTTSTDGGHVPSDTIKMKIEKFFRSLSFPPAVISDEYTEDMTEQAGHSHAYNSGVVTPNLYRREQILIQKTGSAGNAFPGECMVLADREINIENLVRSVAYQNRLLMAAGSSVNRGLGSQNVTFTTSTADDTHDHHTLSPNQNGGWGVDFAWLLAVPTTAGGVHDHDFTLQLNRNVKRARMALYAGSDTFLVTNGLYVLWEGPPSPAAEPFPGWFLADGSNSTINLSDRFIEIAAIGQEGTLSGSSNTLDVAGNSSPVSHLTHETSPATPVYRAPQDIAHDSEVAHAHSIDESLLWQPPHTVLYALGYFGDT